MSGVWLSLENIKKLATTIEKREITGCFIEIVGRNKWTLRGQATFKILAWPGSDEYDEITLYGGCLKLIEREKIKKKVTTL